MAAIKNLKKWRHIFSTTSIIPKDSPTSVHKLTFEFNGNTLAPPLKISLPVKTRLYEALVLCMLLNSAELWPFSVTQMKNLKQHTSHGSVSVYNVGIGIRYFCRYFFKSVRYSVSVFQNIAIFFLSVFQLVHFKGHG